MSTASKIYSYEEISNNLISFISGGFVPDRARSYEKIHSHITIFLHHIYEYEKGLRNLVLYTSRVSYKDFIEKKLSDKHIDYLIHHVTDSKINVFFGNSLCIDVLKNFGNKGLKEFTHEEDFILGIMLGYGRLKQCERYIKRKKNLKIN